MTIWIDKNGVIYHGGGIVLDGMRHFNPSPEQFRAVGYTEYIPPTPEPAPKRYSKLKIIRALGDGWAAKKAQLEAAGLYDLFMAAQFMAEDDPAFAAFCATLSDEERAKLEECIYDE